MSLNGLDDATIKEAHDAAVAEPGGWFLLKYASRDGVEIYSRGASGVIDMRNAIAKYEETSPLYGFLRYRRRTVILKYMPEDCSRLVQARATVHFNAVCERFAPYHTTFDITSAQDLKDTKLSAACSLHAASGSTSSSTSSLRRRRLVEITEEEEEEERDRKRQSVVQEERPGTSTDNIETTLPLSPPFSSPEPPAVLDRGQITSPQEPSFASTAESPNFEGVPRPSSPAKSEYHVRDRRRLSAQTTRPELYSYSSYTYGKPKVKLGPRPSLDASKRPQTAGNFRPVAALPVGFKLASKGSKKGRSQDKTGDAELETSEQHSSNLAAFHASIPIPETPQEPEERLLPPRPSTSSGASMKSIPHMGSIKENRMTPEKARLMKAMKMREQKKKLSMMPSDLAPVVDVPMIDTMSGTAEEQTAENGLKGQDSDPGQSMPNTSSAIAVDLPTPLTVTTEANTDDTFTDSHPPSPIGASSEIGESTKASSLSESTDETVQHTTKDIDKEGGHDTTEGLPRLDDATESATDATPLAMSELIDGVEAKTHDDLGISIQEDALVADEFDNLPEQIEVPSAPTQRDTIRESIEVDHEPDIIQTQVVILPSRDEDLSPKSPYGIPKSRFSSNETKSPATPSLKSKFSVQDLKLPSEPVPALPTLPTSPTAAATSDFGPAQEESHSESPNIDNTQSPEVSPATRKVVVPPIQTDLTKERADSDISDPLFDDALMDELQAATVQEAHPMIVSKSPITPVFPSTSPKKHQTMSRAVSNPLRGALLGPGDISSSSARSVSAGGAAFLHSITRQPSNSGLQAKKGNLGSSISQRIKALEQLTGNPSTEELRPRTATPSTSFYTVRKQNARDPSRSPSVADRANSFTGRTPTPDRSREGSPETQGVVTPRNRSGSVANRLSMFQSQTSGGNAARGRPESIQVTARIVRDPNQAFPWKPASKDPADYNKAELKQSPLVVNHQKAELAPAPIAEPIKLPMIETPKETIQERRLSRDRKSISEDEAGKKRRSSLSIVKDFIKDRRASISSKSTDNLVPMSGPMSPAPNSIKSPTRPPSVHQTTGNSLARRLSISSRRSISRERENVTPLMSPAVVTDPGSGDDDKASLGDKKSMSRTSRFMRRLSNSLGNSRKNITPNISPTLREEDEAMSSVTSIAGSVGRSQPILASYMGDVNVQFPDNLLWKRRSLCLDGQGFLILNAVQGGAVNIREKASVKRYHLSEFRRPYIPDVEVQELPNSVVLDFVEGSGLQIACEDRSGQQSILHILQDAHQSHTSFGQ